MSIGLFAKLMASPEGMKVAGKAAKYAGIGLGVGGFGIYHMVTGKGLVDVAGNTVLGEEYEKEGLAGVIKKKTTGQAGQDKGLVEGVVDTGMGEGTYQKIGNSAEQVVDTVGDSVRAARDTAGNLISGTVGVVRNAMDGSQQQPMYVDPNTGYMPQQTMMNGGASQFTNPFSSISQMVGGLTGMGNTNSMNLAALLASGFLMFGNFGWMGKVISLLTGNMALKSMRQQPAYVSQQNYQQQQSYPFQVAVNPQPQENNDVIPRSRHI